MTRPLLFDSIHLTGFLSFAPESQPIPLQPLNVIIGPNGAGKSNFIEAFALLRSLPRDLPLPIRQGGGVHDWLWRGTDQPGTTRADAIGLEFITSLITPRAALRYRIQLGAQATRLAVLDERLENATPDPGHLNPYFYFAYQNGRPVLNLHSGSARTLRREDIDPEQSILSQRRDPESYPELSNLADTLNRIAIYRAWSFGPNAPFRLSCRVDVRTDHLTEELDNLPARLALLKRNPSTRSRLLDELRRLAHDFDDLEIVPEGGRLQLYLLEGTQSFPAHRLSDGTLRYLALTAILIDPEPPPLILIEEPELGLHFDMMRPLAALLQEAAQRTQLIVTTHSDFLVDALQESPEAIMICEREAGTTTLRRLAPDTLRADPHTSPSLGALWASGHLGGTRW